ncbi:MAG TPA: PQQ-dependent sugar dehydrogenase, partial [Candidatus Methylomirabilis sp.]
WFTDGARSLHPLSLRIPLNFAEFEADPYNAQTNLRERFAVKDILVMPGADGGVRLLASHNHWHADQDCYSLRVSSIETTVDQLLAGTPPAGGWKTAFETQPCRPLTEAPNGKTRNPTLGAGGRLVALNQHEILLSVGGFGPETQTDADDQSSGTQSLNNSYGKTIRIDLGTGQSRIFSWGHRNPQGLAAVGDSLIWLTEHAARGGDELNRVLEGRNYGFPLVSYGTDYESMIWRGNPRQGRHDGYEKPALAWIPSIGVSQLMVIQGNAFPSWRGDLLVSSLSATSLFRVRIEDGRAIFSEQIAMGHRIRDIIETPAGTIVLKTDDNLLVYLEPVDAAAGADGSVPPSARGELLASPCRGCHTFEPGGPNGIGPNLWGVVGRPIASVRNFAYSNGLQAAEGRWTEAALRRFLSNPEAFAPGTAMQQTTTYDDGQLSDLIAYLQTLR